MDAQLSQLAQRTVHNGAREKEYSGSAYYAHAGLGNVVTGTSDRHVRVTVVN